MNKFSIAPWKSAIAFDRAYIRNIKDAQGEIIAQIPDWEDGLEETTANARLMAAAPDLLAACVEALSLFDDYPECYESIGTLERLIAAIARATGDQKVNA